MTAAKHWPAKHWPVFQIWGILKTVNVSPTTVLPSICTRSLRNDLGRCHETGSFYWPRRTIRIIYRKRSGSDLRKYGLLIAQKMIFLMRFHSFFQEIIVKSIEIDVNETTISISWLRIGNPDLPVLFLFLRFDFLRVVQPFHFWIDVGESRIRHRTTLNFEWHQLQPILEA